MAEMDRPFVQAPDHDIVPADVVGRHDDAPHQELAAGPAQPAAAKPVNWSIFVAVNLMKVGLLLQKELMEEKIFSYITHWSAAYHPNSSSVLQMLYPGGTAHISIYFFKPSDIAQTVRVH